MKTPKKVAIFKGFLTEEKFEELCKEYGYSKGNEITPAPQGTIFSGHLTIEKLKELCLEYLEIKSESDQYNPNHNPNIISLEKQDDGSWIAFGTKDGRAIKTRELAPEHALQQLLVS